MALSQEKGVKSTSMQANQILSLIFDYSMKADLVVTTIERIDFVDTESIWHSDQGKQYGAGITIAALLEKGFPSNMV